MSPVLFAAEPGPCLFFFSSAAVFLRESSQELMWSTYSRGLMAIIPIKQNALEEGGNSTPGCLRSRKENSQILLRDGKDRSRGVFFLILKNKTKNRIQRKGSSFDASCRHRPSFLRPSISGAFGSGAARGGGGRAVFKRGARRKVTSPQPWKWIGGVHHPPLFIYLFICLCLSLSAAG